ncbi:hypothetical protein ACNKU7_09880 [Microbulbifer sp. SA54]|uniref:hypothetical protein n=1 Tax=Microbulbifer sp. SA54 TaxID=3401577 RepID=UPI003AAF3179
MEQTDFMVIGNLLRLAANGSQCTNPAVFKTPSRNWCGGVKHCSSGYRGKCLIPVFIRRDEEKKYKKGGF